MYSQKYIAELGLSSEHGRSVLMLMERVWKRDSYTVKKINIYVRYKGRGRYLMVTHLHTELCDAYSKRLK